MDNLKAFLLKNRLFLLMLALGLLLALFSGSSQNNKEADHKTDNELRLEETLEAMRGVGKVSVLLAGDGTRYDTYTGAIIVCDGADKPEIRLRILNAVSAYTGLGTDKIIVERMSAGGNEQ